MRNRSFFFSFNDTAPTEIYTLSLHDALPISSRGLAGLSESGRGCAPARNEDCFRRRSESRSEEHTSELQSRLHLVCRLLLEKKKKKNVCSAKALSCLFIVDVTTSILPHLPNP